MNTINQYLEEVVKKIDFYFDIILKKAEYIYRQECNIQVDFGYDDGEHVQYPGGVEFVEGCMPEDYSVTESNIQNYFESNDIYGFVENAGEVLAILENNELVKDEFLALMKEIDTLYNDFYNELIKITAEWEKENEIENLDSHRVTFCEFVIGEKPAFSKAKAKIIDFMAKINELSTKGMRKMNELGILSYHISNAANNAVQAMNIATPNRAISDIKYYIDVFKAACEKVKTMPGMLPEDLVSIETTVNDLQEIAGRQFYDDVRSFDAKVVQREDAKLVFNNTKYHWGKIAETYAEPEPNIKKFDRREKAKLAAVPSYRYKLGQMVKVGNRVGKVIGMSKEGGNGRAVYEVRIDGVDAPRRCYTNEIKKLET